MAGSQGRTKLQFCKPDEPAKFANRRPGWELPELQLNLQLSSHDPLYQSQGERAVCPKCNKRKSFYCYDCLVALTPAPRLHLPCKVSIITHHEEARSKNTGVQAAILAPDDVVLHSVQHCPDFDATRAVVLFPSDDAIATEDLDFSTVDRVFIIDSRWKKAKALVGEGPLAGVRRVALKGTTTAFWRFHTNGVSDEGVCTIEALYHFFKQLADAGQMPDGFKAPNYFDDLLWYFVYQHNLVREKAMERYQQRREGGKGTEGAPAKGSGAQATPHQPEQQDTTAKEVAEAEKGINEEVVKSENDHAEVVEKSENNRVEEAAKSEKRDAEEGQVPTQKRQRLEVS